MIYTLSSILLVDGGWSSWNGWSPCTETCGGGYQARTRVCNKPPPSSGGNDCTADGSENVEAQGCHENITCSSTIINMSTKPTESKLTTEDKTKKTTTFTSQTDPTSTNEDQDG